MRKWYNGRWITAYCINCIMGGRTCDPQLALRMGKGGSGTPPGTASNYFEQILKKEKLYYEMQVGYKQYT